MRPDVMPRVAARTYRGNDEPLFEQALAMDALSITLENLLLRDVVGTFDFRSFGVALGTHPGDVERRYGGVRGVQRDDVVAAVAILADGGIPIALRG